MARRRRGRSQSARGSYVVAAASGSRRSRMGHPDRQGIPVQPLMITRPRAVVAAAAAVFAAAFVAACAPRTAHVQGPQPSARVGYSDVQAIFNESCEHCHNEDKAKGGLLVESYDELVAGGDHGLAIL